MGWEFWLKKNMFGWDTLVFTHGWELQLSLEEIREFKSLRIYYWHKQNFTPKDTWHGGWKNNWNALNINISWSYGRYFIMFVWSLSFLVASPLLAYRKTNVFKVRISGNHQERNKGKNREYKTTRTHVFSVAETNTHTKRRHCRNRNTEQVLAKEYSG